MDTNEFLEVREHMRAMSDEALLRLMAFQRDEYRPEAVEIAKEELLCRSVTPLTAEDYRARFGIDASGFCQQCIASTVDEQPSRVLSWLGWFAYIDGFADKCPRCFSVVQKAWFRIPLVPVAFPLGEYRVLYENLERDTGRWVARKIRQDA